MTSAADTRLLLTFQFEVLAMEAGKLLLRHRNVPFADSLVAAFASVRIAGYILSDDPHFKTLGIKTKWF